MLQAVKLKLELTDVCAKLTCFQKWDTQIFKLRVGKLSKECVLKCMLVYSRAKLKRIFL